MASPTSSCRLDADGIGVPSTSRTASLDAQPGFRRRAARHDLRHLKAAAAGQLGAGSGAGWPGSLPGSGDAARVRLRPVRSAWGCEIDVFTAAACHVDCPRYAFPRQPRDFGGSQLTGAPGRCAGLSPGWRTVIRDARPSMDSVPGSACPRMHQQPRLIYGKGHRHMPETVRAADITADTLGRSVRLEGSAPGGGTVFGRVVEVRHRLVGDDHPPASQTRFKIQVFGDQVIVVTVASEQQITVG